LETLLVSVQDRCTICAKHTIGFKNHFGCTPWYSLMMGLKWKLDSVRLEIVQILMHDRCIVWAERTRGSEIVLYTPDGTTM
jgi:hypothetical protein